MDLITLLVVVGTRASSMRSLRPFLRWMADHGIAWADGIHFRTDGSGGWGVYAARDMEEGEPIVRIPTTSCLTATNTGAAAQIEAACLGGGLALAVAVMYERSLGAASPWYEYLAVLPPQEDVPIAWGVQQVHQLLRGTELHQTVVEDLRLIRQDWLHCIAPLSKEHPATFPPAHFSLAAYAAAKTLVSSRAFAIDRHHTMAMVPFADMLNHKTAAEDVHLMIGDEEADSDAESSLASGEELEEASAEEVDDSHTTNSVTQDEGGCASIDVQHRAGVKEGRGPKRRKYSSQEGPERCTDGESPQREGNVEQGQLEAGGPQSAGVSEERGNEPLRRGSRERQEEACQAGPPHENGAEQTPGRDAVGITRGTRSEGRAGDEERAGEEDGELDRGVFEMVLLHDLPAGSEVFNTYGRLSSGALLYRYAFTERGNPFDLVNLEAYHVAAAAAAAPGCSPRQVRARWALWRAALGSTHATQAWQYFEVACSGQPEAELLLLLYVIHASESTVAALAHHPDEGCDVRYVAALLGFPQEEPQAGKRNKRRRSAAAEGTTRQNGASIALPGRIESEETGRDAVVGSGNEQGVWCPAEDPVQDWLLTPEVARSLLRALDAREEAYQAGPLAGDEATWATLDAKAQPRKYHALALRIAERQVLQRCRQALGVRRGQENGRVNCVGDDA